MEKAQREWIRGAGPLAVLKMLDQREMYGYELVEMLESRSDGVLAMGHSTLYPLLYNLESKELIEVVRKTTTNGRVRKYYRITPGGAQWLASHSQEWTRLVDAMGKLGLA